LATAVLQVYFSTLQSESIASVPAYDSMALLSDVGGALGLLLGATLLTVFEVAEFILHLIHDVIKMKRNHATDGTENSASASGATEVMKS
jgi:hypothetical protein